MQTRTDQIRKLRRDGHRLTKARLTLIFMFSDTTSPLSAREVREKLKEKGVVVNKTTVYRELKFLNNQGIIKPVQIKRSVVAYESTLLPHHHHLVCKDCGKVSEVSSANIEKSIDKLTKQVKEQGFVINSHNLEFFGVCPSCK